MILLSEEQVLNLRKQLSANRWRKREPLDDEIQFEIPKALEKSFNLVLENNVQDIGDILASNRLSKATIEALIGTSLPEPPHQHAATPEIHLKPF